MAITFLVQEPNGTWRIHDAASGERIGRIWQTSHADFFQLFADLAEAIAAIINQSGATRRASARTAYNNWLAAGGSVGPLRNLTFSPNNDAGEPDGMWHVYLNGVETGTVVTNEQGAPNPKMQRYKRLAEDIVDAEALGTQTLRNQALDAGLNRFRDAGGIS